MPTILACVDGSRFSGGVCDHAAWAARRLGAAVDVVYVLDRRHAPSSSADLSAAPEPDLRDTLLAELAALDEQQSRVVQRHGWIVLDEARARLVDAGVSDVRVHQMQGAVVDTISGLDTDVDLLVIGKRGSSAGSAQGHLGSNLERVARASRHPLLVATEEFQPIERCVVAFDGGPSSLRAVSYIAGTPLLAGAACHLLMVGPRGAEASGQLDAALTTLTRAGYTATAGVEAGEHVEAVITAEVTARRADLLVMGAYGHSRIRELIIGSTTTAMLRLSSVPVLLFR